MPGLILRVLIELMRLQFYIGPSHQARSAERTLNKGFWNRIQECVSTAVTLWLVELQASRGLCAG